VELCGGEILSVVLLDADAGNELAAAVPKGCFAVYLGAEARRFVVPTSYIRQPLFRNLMERTAEEFGFARAGAIHIPCREEDF
jgi:SAUR family protein